MPNPLSALVAKQAHLLNLPFVRRLKRDVLGLVDDFWKDGPENLFKLDLRHVAKSSPATSEKTGGFAPQPSRAVSAWHAEPGEIAEKMWGEGSIVPLGRAVDLELLKPLALAKNMNVLDLSASLGARLRGIVAETGAAVTGFEQDAGVAARGMKLSAQAGMEKQAAIASYDSATLQLDRSYDRVIAREIFYRVHDRAAFAQVLRNHTKPKALASFTDYIVDPEHRKQQEILDWLGREAGANPIGTVETAEVWAKADFDLRHNEDMTELYKAEILAGTRRLMAFLATGVHPDKETAVVLMREVEIWKYRLGALEAGMKFCRFHLAKR